MGRPLKQKYFDPNGTPSTGGEGVTITSGNVSFASVTRGTGYYNANVAATISSPQLTGGTAATLSTVHLFANGAIKTVAITSGGTGYTSVPTITFTGANSGTATATVSIDATTTTANAIAISAWLLAADGGTQALAGDIVKQTGAKSFRVATSEGTGKVVLTTGSVATGQCQITATKQDTTTFYVASINGHTVKDSSGNKYLWTVDSPDSTTTPETVTIGTY